MYLGIHLPYVFESEQTIMCCFLRIHFSIPFSNRRFLTSDQVIITQYLQATAISITLKLTVQHSCVEESAIIFHRTPPCTIVPPTNTETSNT